MPKFTSKCEAFHSPECSIVEEGVYALYPQHPYCCRCCVTFTIRLFHTLVYLNRLQEWNVQSRHKPSISIKVQFGQAAPQMTSFSSQIHSNSHSHVDLLQSDQPRSNNHLSATEKYQCFRTK